MDILVTEFPSEGTFHLVDIDGTSLSYRYRDRYRYSRYRYRYISLSSDFRTYRIK